MDPAGQGELLKYGCIVQLSLPQHGVACHGVGVAEDVVDLEKGEVHILGYKENCQVSCHCYACHSPGRCSKAAAAAIC